MAQQALNFAQRKNSTLNFLTENDFLQEEKIVVVKSMQKRRRFEQAEQSNTPHGTEYHHEIFMKLLERAASEGTKRLSQEESMQRRRRIFKQTE